MVSKICDENQISNRSWVIDYTIIMQSIYYSPRGYWKGRAAIDKLANAANVKRSTSAAWLARQAIWQIYLPPPKRIEYAHFDVNVPNEVYQADILFLPHDRIRKATFKYALTVVDVASRYKEAEPLSTKTATEVASAFERIYRRGSIQGGLRWPQLLQVDPGKEFLGAVSSLMKRHNVTIRRGHTEIHRDQAIVERFNRTLAERLFGYQYAKEFIQDTRSREWVARLPSVIATLNNEVTRTTAMKPINAITKKYIPIQHNIPPHPILGNVIVRYLYERGELEGGKKRATDPIWSITTHKISSITRSTGRPPIYRLDSTAPQRGFTREQLQVIPEDTQLPPRSLN